jgi:hypothetical protein
MADLLSWIESWVKTKSDHYVYAAIPADGATALVPMKSYFRIFIADMFLAESSKWFTDWYPSVTGTVKLKYANQEISLNAITEAPKSAVSKGVKLNYRLMDLTPFNGGLVEIGAALLAVPGNNLLSAAVATLSDFSSLIAAPLGPAIPIAQKVQAGIQKFLDDSHGGVHLGLHQTFTSAGGDGANPLVPGYLAVVLAPTNKFAKERLSVKDDQLVYAARAGAEAQPLTGYDYMLLRVEGRTERDDWRLKDISDPLGKAVEALLKGDDKEAEAFRVTAITAAWQSDDLAVGDRRRVVQAIKAELDAVAKEGRQAVGDEVRSLADIVKVHAISAELANRLMPITLEEALSDGH